MWQKFCDDWLPWVGIALILFVVIPLEKGWY